MGRVKLIFSTYSGHTTYTMLLILVTILGVLTTTHCRPYGPIAGGAATNTGDNRANIGGSRGNNGGSAGNIGGFAANNGGFGGNIGGSVGNIKGFGGNKGSFGGNNAQYLKSYIPRAMMQLQG